jgi:hypothetical protein
MFFIFLLPLSPVLTLNPKFFPQHSVFKCQHSMLFIKYAWKSFTSTQKFGNILVVYILMYNRVIAEY